MTVRRTDDGVVELEGVCEADDAGALLQALFDAPDALVDWRTCEEAHAAVIQVLLATEAELRGPPASAFLRDHVEPALAKLRMPGRPAGVAERGQ